MVWWPGGRALQPVALDALTVDVVSSRGVRAPVCVAVCESVLVKTVAVRAVDGQ